MNQSIGLSNAIHAFRRYWWAILISMAIGLLLALAYLSQARPVYSATAIVGPRQSFLPMQRGANLGVGGLLSSLQGGPDDMDLARADIFWTSGRLADDLARSDATVRQLFPGRWDDHNKRWHREASLSTFFYDVAGIVRPDRPTSGEVQKLIARNFSTEIELQTFRTLIYKDRSPKSAEAMLSKVISATNDSFRKDDISEISRIISYSYERLDRSVSQRDRENLSSLVQDLERQRIQMESTQNHLFEVIQQPIAEPIPVSPTPLLVVIVGLVVPPSIVIGVLILWPSAVSRRRTTGAEQSD